MHVLLDAGHGGMVNGKYVTPGKRSPVWNDLPQLFEGVQNRAIVSLLKVKLTAANIKFTDVVSSENDISLKQRVSKANSIYTKDKSAVYISIHADAAGKGIEDYPATGISVWTSPGQTKSDTLATKVYNCLDKKLGNTTKKRADHSDGDPDNEAHFQVLTSTTCPAILCELGFMTNRKECELMQSAKWKEDCAQAIFDGILNYYNNK
jgi:N-acetylmuramoyl-L-alanine amidase